MSGSFSQAGSPGSLKYCAVITPSALSKPTTFSTACTELPGLAMNCMGFHLSSSALRSAWAENFGVVKFMNTLAPEPARLMTCESTVGSVSS